MELATVSVPKILHQLWIGPKAAPAQYMDTWRTMHPEFTYILWNEQRIQEHDAMFTCQHRVLEAEEMCGKADILRWEILYAYGGVFVDADSVCISALDDSIMRSPSFASWESEVERPGLIAVGTMGFPPKHPLVAAAVEFIRTHPMSHKATGLLPWQLTGPTLLTRLHNSGLYPPMTVLPSYTFLPVHITGAAYAGHSKVYAHQEWGTTHAKYDAIAAATDIIPLHCTAPSSANSVSLLICSLNAAAEHVSECLESIKAQTGRIALEIVWVNDGSSDAHTADLLRQLAAFQDSTRFCTVKYCANSTNLGVGAALSKGLALCSHDIVMRMDSDDIMLPTRVATQLAFMRAHPECVLCGAQIQMFDTCGDGKKVMLDTTAHPDCDVATFLATKPMQHWLANHPTFCFKRAEIAAIGGYNPSLTCMLEDFDLLVRVLQTHGKIHNLPDIVLLYRLHEGQVTHGQGGNPIHAAAREAIVRSTFAV
jgi:GT2 family glycosyltransferase